MNSRFPLPIREPILQRICSEYLEMPGLQLTIKQAQRLWGLDEATCAKSLGHLVDSGFLCRAGRESYVRRSEGSVASPPMGMVKASRDRSRAGGLDRARAS